MTITIADFKAMNTGEQSNLIWQGTFLGSRFEGPHLVQLYSVFSFYVEVFYDPDKNAISDFNAFRPVKRLDPYLDELKY